MITIKTNGTSEVTVFGHAGYAPHGQDIVCAGVSALFQTLALSAEDAQVEQWPLQARIRAAPTEHNRILFQAFALGCEEIAKQYPDYVKIEYRE